MNRVRIWEIVEVARASRLFDLLILSLIFLNAVAVIVGSVPDIQKHWSVWLDRFEVFSVAVFTVEYLARLWSCTAQPEYKHPVLGRLKMATTPMCIIDLLSILPFYLPFFGFDLRSLRVLRLLRIFRLAKAGRYYKSLTMLREVIVEKRAELLLTSTLMVLLLVISSSLLYFCEHAAQPKVFSSIPATMWWSVATLTTIGYGDMYPVTLAGKLITSLIAILGIGMFALPTGILGAGFVEAMEKSRADHSANCPHCGKPIER